MSRADTGSTIRVVMVGTALNTQGGVSTVVNVLQGGGLFERFAERCDVAPSAACARMGDACECMRNAAQIIIFLVDHIFLTKNCSFGGVVCND